MREHAPQAKDLIQNKGSRYRKLTEAEQSANRHKSKTRSRVEHVFGVMKRQFGFSKVRYRGLEKNAHCMDNAPSESFFHTLKTELTHHRRY